jgi:hypothetical protein
MCFKVIDLNLSTQIFLETCLEKCVSINLESRGNKKITNLDYNFYNVIFSTNLEFLQIFKNGYLFKF